MGAANDRRRPGRVRLTLPPGDLPPPSASGPTPWRLRPGAGSRHHRTRGGPGRCPVGGDGWLLPPRAARPAGARPPHRGPAGPCRRAPRSLSARCRRSVSDRSPTECCRSSPAAIAPHQGSRRGGDQSGRGMLRSLWQPLVGNVPRLGRAGEQRGVEDLILDLLQRTPVPWSMHWREMTPPPQWSSTDWMTLLRTHQAPYLYTITELLGVPNTRRGQGAVPHGDRQQPGPRRAARAQGRRRHGLHRRDRRPGPGGHDRAPRAQPAPGLDRPARSAAGVRRLCGDGPVGIGGARSSG